MTTPFSQSSAWRPRVIRALEVGRTTSALAAVRLLVEGLRPADGEIADARARALTEHLEAHPELGEGLGVLLRTLVSEARLYPALTESGIPGSEAFVQGIVHRLGRRVLPRVLDTTDLRDTIRTVFDRRTDHHWVSDVPDATWRRLLVTLGITADTVPGVGPELAAATRVLSHHAASLGLQPEVTRRLPHLEHGDSPFLRLTDRVGRYLESFDNEISGDEEPRLDEALELVARCRREVERLRAEKGRFGTSLHLTGLSDRLGRVLDRLDLLLHLGEPVERDFQGCAVRLFKELVTAEKTRDHLTPHVKASADLLALEVVEHAARKGAKYITRGRRDYFGFLLSSMGGGLIVAIFALVKLGLGGEGLPLGLQALLYGLNYSVCFVLIYLTGATLATKQPAMTANTIARSMGASGQDLDGLADLIVRVWRSQFVAFVGNLATAFPAALLLSLMLERLVGEPLVSESKAESLLVGLHPWLSGALLYAAVAGVLLFLSGLVAGWFDNWSLNHSVPERVAAHPGLHRVLGVGGARRFAHLLDQKLGALAGNVFLGFGLGSFGTLGTILGLPLDIRHIAFASAHFGTSLEVLGSAGVPAGLVVAVVIGVGAIGLVNFVVSFGLSLITALESRRIGFTEGRQLARHLGRRLRDRPLDWFLPPRTERSAS